MNSFFQELYAYSHHSNQGLAEGFLKNSTQTSEKAILLFSHLLNAHRIWNDRIAGTPISVGVWQVQPVSEFKRIDENNYRQSLEILEGTEMEKIIQYSNSKGQKFSNNVRDILFHIINHSTYHRAQIATEFKNAGIAPLATDYIFYKR